MTTSSQGRAPLPARRDRRARAALAVRWIGAGEAIDVYGFKMSGGLLYIGSVRPVTLCDRDRRQAHVIDPAVRIDPRLANVAGQTMSYWPSYAEIGPAARRGYLKWLATGRRDPNAGIDHVFLSFYGLEQRLFGHGAWQDASAITDVLEALLSVYGENASFRGYARRFLDTVAVVRGTVADAPVLDPSARSHGEMPLAKAADQ